MRADRIEPAALPWSRTLATLLIVGGIGTIFYWISFFTAGSVQATGDECYLAFERAFPAADGWTAVAAILAGFALWRRRPAAVLFGIAAGSAFVFLGLIDVLYNLENGMYALGNTEMAAEALINVFCLSVGPAAIGYAWRYRAVLDPR
jgi:hypothetical protein